MGGLPLVGGTPCCATLTLNGGPVIEVEGLGKRYCRDLRRSLRYGLLDIASEFMPWRAAPDEMVIRRGEFAALEDVSLRLDPGDSIAVLGTNGAGKSTLLKILYGLIKPDAGTVRINGSIAGLIELGTGFDPVLSGRENIAVNASLLGLEASRLRHLTDEIIEFAELEESIDTPVRYYSSGMVSRLAFSVAAHLNADVLLVDEVLAVGDVGFQRKCATLMLSYLESGGALIFVSHNIPQAQAICDRGLLLEAGKVSHAGPVVDTVAAYLARQAELADAHPTGNRGSMPIEITDVRITNCDAGLPRSRDRARIEVDYRCHEAYEVVWGFTLWTGDHWTCITGDYDMRPRRLVGEGTVSATIPSLPLVGGAYAARIVIGDASSAQPLGLRGWTDNPVPLEVESSPSLINNAMAEMAQLTVIDVEWD